MAQEPWPQVAQQGVMAFGGWPLPVPLSIVGGTTVLLLAGIAAWYLTKRRPSPGTDGTVPAAVMITVTEEFSRQVGHMATVVEGLSAVVEDLRDSIKGCSTCHYNPHARIDQPPTKRP